MKIDKVLNNNVIIAKDNDGKEIIAMGRGIAFGKKPGDIIPQQKINKVFTPYISNLNSKLKDMLARLPEDYILLTEKVVDLAQNKLGKPLNDTIYLTLIDHISGAIERCNQGLQIENALIWDIRQFYPQEYRVSLEAVSLINEEMGTTLPDDEAGFIAMHFISAQVGGEISVVQDTANFIRQITTIVKYHFGLLAQVETSAFFRFINHLKYFSQRLWKHATYPSNEDDEELLQSISQRNPEAYACANKVAEYICQQYDHKLNPAEMLYMTVHIARVVSETKQITKK